MPGWQSRITDACARDVEKEFYSGCLGTCGKTCGELGHDPVLFEKLRAAVKKWPDGGGGEAIPDVCAFRPKFAWDQDDRGWITGLYVLAWLGLLVIYVVGVAAACCVSQPSCAGYARLQKLRNWAHEGEGGCGRRCVFWCCGGWIFAYLELSLRRPALLGVTIVSVVLTSILAGLWVVYGLGAFLLFVALFFGGNLFVLRGDESAYCEVGIESTVLKLDEESRKLLLRAPRRPRSRLAPACHGRAADCPPHSPRANGALRPRWLSRTPPVLSALSTMRHEARTTAAALCVTVSTN